MRITPADEALLSLLREDARASTADIARQLGLSRTTVQNRIAKLEQMLFLDKSNGRAEGLKQFLDDKTYRPGLGAYKR